MSTINSAMQLLDSVLLNPKAQKPTVAQKWTQLAFEFQNLTNELNNTSLPWTTTEIEVTITPGTEDYLVPGNVGKVLFAYANTDNDYFGPISIEFADFAGVSSDFYLFSPLDYGFSRDFNEVSFASVPLQMALFREGGSLKFRVPPFSTTSFTSITLVTSVGNWIDELSPSDEMVLPGHHMLAIVRAAINLLPGSEWAGEREFNVSQRQQLALSLPAQEQRYAQSWMIAKRTMSADQPSYRIPYGGEW